uniref:Uncharacterized protein n=1 Tax=Anguilla anguilla TaxID=7936 RepID=A0A0E9US08_ANGAN
MCGLLAGDGGKKPADVFLGTSCLSSGLNVSFYK